MGMSGLVLTKLLPAGTLVKAGEVVAELNGEDLRTSIDDLKAGLEQAQIDVAQQRAQQALDWDSLQQTVRSGEAAAEQAKLDFGAAEVKTASDQEILRLDMEEAEARYRQQLKSLDFEKTSLEASARAAEIELQRQRLVYERSLGDLKALTFYAPMDGMVILQNVERSGGTTALYAAGDQVYPGRTFMRIVDTSSMQVEALASQAETAELRVGQQAEVSLDALPGGKFSAKIYSLGAIARPRMLESYYVRTVPVSLQIQGRDPRLLPSMSASADVTLGREENRLLVPLEALQEESGHCFVYVKTSQGFEKRSVEAGLRGATQAAILSGLKEGDLVALSRPAVIGRQSAATALEARYSGNVPSR